MPRMPCITWRSSRTICACSAAIRRERRESDTIKAMRIATLFLTALLLPAQLPNRVQTGYDAIQANRLRADLTFLSSDALEGRRSLTRGSEVAIQWIASQFAAAGLKPAAGDSYLQSVPLLEYTPDRDATSLMFRTGDQAKTFRSPDITVNFPDELTLSGPVVFAGFGITA